mgnify:FL=1
MGIEATAPACEFIASAQYLGRNPQQYPLEMSYMGVLLVPQLVLWMMCNTGDYLDGPVYASLRFIRTPHPPASYMSPSHYSASKLTEVLRLCVLLGVTLLELSRAAGTCRK